MTPKGKLDTTNMIPQSKKKKKKKSLCVFVTRFLITFFLVPNDILKKKKKKKKTRCFLSHAFFVYDTTVSILPLNPLRHREMLTL